MQIDWSTFSLQILNFLVLVWLLKRLLYKPVLGVIQERKARIDRLRTEAEQIRQEGETLRTRYEQRLADWAAEKERARAELVDELQMERARLQQELRVFLEQEREKATVQEARRKEEFARQIEEVALNQAAQFAARLLMRLANADVHARIVELAIEQLQSMPEARRQALQAACGGLELPVSVASAYPVSEGQRQQIEETVADLLGRPLPWTWSEDTELMGGLRITLGPWVLAANLRDELKAFAESSYGDRRVLSA